MRHSVSTTIGQSINGVVIVFGSCFEVHFNDFSLLFIRAPQNTQYEQDGSESQRIQGSKQVCITLSRSGFCFLSESSLGVQRYTKTVCTRLCSIGPLQHLDSNVGLCMVCCLQGAEAVASSLGTWRTHTPAAVCCGLLQPTRSLRISAGEGSAKRSPTTLLLPNNGRVHATLD